MRKYLTVFSVAFLVALGAFTSAKAQIKFTDPSDFEGTLEILAGLDGSLYRTDNTRFSLDVKCNDPNNNLSGNYPFELSYTADEQALQFGQTGSKAFNLNCAGTGKSFSQNINLTSAGLSMVQAANGEAYQLPVSLSFTGESDPGFQSLGFTLSITPMSEDPVDDEDELTAKDLNLMYGITGLSMPSFGTYNINNLESNGDLKVTYELKIDKTIYDNVVNNLENGETIGDKIKEATEGLGLKLNMRNLRKLAKQQVKQAGRGLTGEEKESAQQTARETGVTQLVDTIVGKLPPLPSTQTNDPEERERLRTIRKARKKNILEALEIEVGETTDATEGELAVKCIEICITLPVELCAAEGEESTLLIGGRRVRLKALELGETITANIPVKIVGFFKKFVGDTNKKGKRNGKIDIPIVITNPAE